MFKKITVMMFVGAILSLSGARADINVVWGGADGWLRNDDATGILEPVNTGLTALAQLIFTPLNDYGVAGLGGSVEFDEQVLATFEITDASGTDAYGNFAEPYTGAFQAGYIYARIFDGGTGSDPANQIVNGTWYYNGPIVATIDNITPDSPDSYNANGANTSPNFGFGDVLNLQVPEPSVLAFFGIGGLALAIRRRIKA